MKRKLTIITKKDCPPCDELESQVRGLKNVRLLDLDKSDEAVRAVIDHRISEVPTALMDNGKEVRKCKLKYTESGDLLADCGQSDEDKIILKRKEVT